MIHSRRRFLKSLLALPAVGVAMYSLRSLASPAEIKNYLVVGSDKGASLVDLDAHTVKHVSLDFSPHSFVPHPSLPMRFVGIEKWGWDAAEVDFEKGTARPIPSGDGFQFYGHGIYIEEHKAVFIARVDTKTGLGHLVGYDPITYEILRDFQVAPGGLHDCHRLSDGTLMFASSGIRLIGDKVKGDKKPYLAPLINGEHVAPSALIRIDIQDGKVLGQLPIEDEIQSIGHFAVTKNGEVLALCTSRKGRVGNLYYSPNLTGPLKPVKFNPDIQARLIGEMLSVALNADHSHAAVTNPASSTVILVDMKTGEVLKTQNEMLLNIAFNPKHPSFLGSFKKLKIIDDAFTHVDDFALNDPNPSLNGAHSILVNS
jgi:hypothetical protein